MASRSWVSVLSKLQEYVPAGIKGFLRRHVNVLEYDREVWRQSMTALVAEKTSRALPSTEGVRLGILWEFSYHHLYYVAACEEMGVPYTVVDLTATDWIRQIRESQCSAFLAWPSPALSIWRDLCVERVRILEKELGMLVFPTHDELWLYESKRRTRDWLEAHGFAHPRTWVFFDAGQALDFVERCQYPVVLKCDFGSSANGVTILQSVREARRMVRRAFGRGLLTKRGDPRDRQWGSVVLQEYVEHDREWRMVRVGDSYFCRLKRKVGDFASGSGQVEWARPDPRLLDLTRELTERGHFRSMSIDFFEVRKQGSREYLVNELHPVFGATPSASTEATGRYRYDGERWQFEPGFFYQNACANLRVQYLLDKLAGKKVT